MHILERQLFSVEFGTIIDSKLGQTSKNIISMFNEMNNISNPSHIVILFDEIDAIALDRVNSNDLREMGRVTSTILKEFDKLNDEIILIATTNLFNSFDKALIRRFDSVINFNRYSEDDLVDVAESILNTLLSKFKFASRNMRLFQKIIRNMNPIPYPGDLKNMIKTSLAFSNSKNEFDYLKKLFVSALGKDISLDLKRLHKMNFTLRELEIITGTSKSQISRELKE
jgi:AAA+ superfamily predicted ATPase